MFEWVVACGAECGWMVKIILILNIRPHFDSILLGYMQLDVLTHRSWSVDDVGMMMGSRVGLIELIIKKVVAEDILLANDIIIDLTLNIFDRIWICGLAPSLAK